VCDGVGVRLPQPVGPRAKLVVDRHLAVEHERAGGQLGDCGGQIIEAASVVAPVPAQETDAVAGLVGEDAPAVHFLLVDPAVAVERLADERGGHGGVLGNHDLGLYLAAVGRYGTTG
jgi:hypothetical protein